MEQSFPSSIGHGGFTLPSDINCFSKEPIDCPRVPAIVRSSLSLNSACSDRQQFAHCLQSIRAKYFWLSALTRPSMLSGAFCFSQDRKSQFSSSRSSESCWILD